jgi:hypothetical protein
MSVNTHFITESTLEELIDFLDIYGFHVAKYDQPFDVLSRDNSRYGRICLIRLGINENKSICREMYVHELFNDTEYADRETTLPPLINGVWCDLGCHDESVFYGKIMCSWFGGWLDENDCDDKDFYRIDKIHNINKFSRDIIKGVFG